MMELGAGSQGGWLKTGTGGGGGFFLQGRVRPYLTQLGSNHRQDLFRPRPLSPPRFRSIPQRTQRPHPKSTSLGQG